MISNFFNQPFVVGVGTILVASFIERKVEKYTDKKIEVSLLSFLTPIIFQWYFRFCAAGRSSDPQSICSGSREPEQIDWGSEERPAAQNRKYHWKIMGVKKESKLTSIFLSVYFSTFLSMNDATRMVPTPTTNGWLKKLDIISVLRLIFPSARAAASWSTGAKLLRSAFKAGIDPEIHQLMDA